MRIVLASLLLFIVASPAFAQIFNVKAFGAVGDGLTDDTHAFQEAARALPSGGTLFIPQGRYVISKNNASDGIQFAGKNHVAIVGENTQSQLLYYYSSFISGKTNRAAALNITDSTKVSIRNLSILGMADLPSPSYSYSSETSGILIEHCSDVTIEEVHVARMSGNGLLISSEVVAPSRRVVVKNSRLNQNRVSGIWAENVDEVSVSESEMNSNGQIGDPATGYGFAGSARSRMGYPAHVVLENNEASRNVRKGLDFHAGVHLSLINNSVFENGLYGIDVEGPGLGGEVKIIGNHISAMGAPTAEMLQITNDHPVVKADYTSQLCAICILYYKKAVPTLPAKSFKILHNTIENLSMMANTNDVNAKTYAVYVFGLVNISKPERDPDLVFDISDNRILNSTFTALFLQDTPGEFVPGIIAYKFERNYIEFTGPEGLHRLALNDASQVQFKDNHFALKSKTETTLVPPTGTTNDQRIAQVAYVQSPSNPGPIAENILKKLKFDPNGMVTPAKGWVLPQIESSGNRFVGESFSR